MPSAEHSVKEQAMQLVGSMPTEASWDDIMSMIYVRQAIDAGLSDADAGRVVDVGEVRRQFGLAP